MAAEILPKGGEGGEQYKAEAGGVDISPEQRDQLENYIDNMMLLIHKQPAADKIIEGLQRVKNPQAAIAVTANEVNEMLLRGFQENGKQYNNVTLFYGSYFLVKELIELGEIAGLFKLTEPERFAAYTLAVQHFIGKGIKDGTIDPVGLQKGVEPLMPDDLRAKGQAAMNQAQGPQAREVMQ